MMFMIIIFTGYLGFLPTWEGTRWILKRLQARGESGTCTRLHSLKGTTEEATPKAACQRSAKTEERTSQLKYGKRILPAKLGCEKAARWYWFLRLRGARSHSLSCFSQLALQNVLIHAAIPVLAWNQSFCFTDNGYVDIRWRNIRCL